MLHPHLVFSSSHGFIDSFPFLLNTKLERCHDHRILFIFLSPPVSHMCYTEPYKGRVGWILYRPDRFNLFQREMPWLASHSEDWRACLLSLQSCCCKNEMWLSAEMQRLVRPVEGFDPTNSVWASKLNQLACIIHQRQTLWLCSKHVLLEYWEMFQGTVILYMINIWNILKLCFHNMESERELLLCLRQMFSSHSDSAIHL